MVLVLERIFNALGGKAKGGKLSDFCGSVDSNFKRRLLFERKIILSVASLQMAKVAGGFRSKGLSLLDCKNVVVIPGDGL